MERPVATRSTVIDGAGVQQLRGKRVRLGGERSHRNDWTRGPLPPVGGRTFARNAPVPRVRARGPFPQGPGDPSDPARLEGRRVRPDPGAARRRPGVGRPGSPVLDPRASRRSRSPAAPAAGRSADPAGSAGSAVAHERGRTDPTVRRTGSLSRPGGPRRGGLPRTGGEEPTGRRRARHEARRPSAGSQAEGRHPARYDRLIVPIRRAKGRAGPLPASGRATREDSGAWI